MKKYHFNKILILTLFLILAVFFFFLYKKYHWISFRSNTVLLSFNHPQNWPVTQCSTTLPFKLLEAEGKEIIFFADVCDLHQFKGYGDIRVYKVGKIVPEKYLDINGPFSGKKELKTIKIGNTTGYYIQFLEPRTNDSKDINYYVFANDYGYYIRLFGKYSENKKIVEIFHKILSTFRF